VFDAAQPRCGSNGITFHQAVQDFDNRFFRNAHINAEWRFSWLSVVFAALLALVPLNSVPALNRPSGVRFRVCLKQNYGFKSKVSQGRNHRESITTVLRRSSAEEKLPGRAGEIALSRYE